MHTKVFRGLSIRHASLFDQPHSLKLELACKLPSLHDTPPVPSKHLTRCLRNRQQARSASFCLIAGCCFLHCLPCQKRFSAWSNPTLSSSIPGDRCNQARQG